MKEKYKRVSLAFLTRPTLLGKRYKLTGAQSAAIASYHRTLLEKLEVQAWSAPSRLPIIEPLSRTECEYIVDALEQYWFPNKYKRDVRALDQQTIEHATAAELGMKPGTLKKRRQRARKKLGR
jgi:hypothetical protein